MGKPSTQICIGTAFLFAVTLAPFSNEPVAIQPPQSANDELAGPQLNADAAKIQAAGHRQLSDLPKRLYAQHLHNAILITDRVISGGLPEGEAAFVELRNLGVKTVISVDGARPELALSERYGLRYVHLPHGYNGIPATRAMELAKAVRDLEGPIYIHCHHGKHRSPTAAVVACIANGSLDPTAAISILKFAGTNDNYRGLYQSAKAARQIDDSVLDAFEAAFPATAQLPPFAEAMVSLEHTYDHLKQLAANAWNPLPEHPDLDPSHEALLLNEHFTEMLRLDSVANEPKAFRSILQQSESDARKMVESLIKRQNNSTSSRDMDEPFNRIADNCNLCHQQFRDVPLRSVAE